MRISDWSSDVCSSDLQNTGQGYVNLVDWDDRPGPDNTADAIAQRARGALSGLRDAQIFALVPGAVRGLGDTSGFTMEFQNRSGMSRDEFAAARSDEHTSELQSLMRTSYAVFCLTKKNTHVITHIKHK